MKRCLYCYQELPEDTTDFHPACAKKFFGSTKTLVLPYTRDNINDLAKLFVGNKATVTGIQPKISMDINRGGKDEPDKLTIVGLCGNYILKPQSKAFQNLPENEDLVMHLAAIAKIKTVPHTLIRFADGELCYLTRRIDRGPNGMKYHLEDLCQITERLTADKYKSSYEKIAKAIIKYSSIPKLDLVNFWETIVFSWLTGNSDMHLKNFSLINTMKGHYQLSPFYDLLSVRLAMPHDKEELALTMNGKKNRITKSDFETAMLQSGLQNKVIQNIFDKFTKAEEEWHNCIAISFLPETAKQQLSEIIHAMIKQI